MARPILSGAKRTLPNRPTNDFDFPAREALTRTPKTFYGTVPPVSHNRYLAEQAATRVWAVSGEIIAAVAGKYTTDIACGVARSNQCASRLPQMASHQPSPLQGRRNCDKS